MEFQLPMKTIPALRLVTATHESLQPSGFKWAAGDVGKRHQLGGSPARPISDGDWPRCPDCSERMTFYGQLDSINDEFCIADAGLVYVFVCFDCNEAKAIIEST
jgi:hypothetical protein